MVIRNFLNQLKRGSAIEPGLPERTFVRLQRIQELVSYLRPECQRIVSLEHVEELMRDMEEDLKVRGELSVLQSITVAQLPDETHFILDGSHRLMALSRLLPRNFRTSLADVKLPVVVYRCCNTDEVRFWYQRINHHLPIHPLELELSWSDKVKPLLGYIQDNYRSYLSASKSPRCPQIHLQQIQTALLKRAEALQHEDITPDGLVDDLREMHEIIHRNLLPLQMAPIERLEKCVRKRPDKPCFLGFWRNEEWIDLLIYRRVNKLQWEDIEWARFGELPRKRIAIPLPIRRQVWAKTNTASAGICYVCEDSLDFEHMECAHDIPHILGGADSISNLWPTCRGCNRDMGIQPLHRYRQIVQRMRGGGEQEE